MSEAKTLNVAEAAKMLGVSAPSLYRYIRDGRVAGIRIGGRVLVLREALERMLAGEPLSAPSDSHGDRSEQGAA